MNILIFIVATALIWVAPVAQQSATSDLRLISTGVGPGGAVRDGVFVLSEERSTFSRTDDKELVVTFQWEGKPGVHRMIATWRGPDGTLSSSAPVEYEATDRRFGAYWHFSLSPNTALGTWFVDVTVDGRLGARLSFELTGEAVAPGVAKKQILTQPQLFEALNAMHVVLQRSTSAGRQLDPAAALLAGGGRLFTVSSAIDEADRVLAHPANGDARPVTNLMAWSRTGHWAVLPSSLTAPAAEPVLAGQKTISIGDRCYALDGSVVAARVLLEGSVIGRTAGQKPMWIVSFVNGDARPGSPVLNESGELLGVTDGPTSIYEALRVRHELRGSPVIPYTEMSVPDEAPHVPLADLRSRGELMPPVTGESHVVSGGFASSINRGPVVAPADQRAEFSTSEKSMTVFVSWSPHERLRGMLSMKLFDADNRPIVQTPPKKTNLRKQNLMLSTWQITMLRTPGVYRADVMIDNLVMWRGYVRITS
jgi:hypothetical protein